MSVCTPDKHVWEDWQRCRCRELRRCVASYARGGQCRRRAAEGSSYCVKHAWVPDRIDAVNRACLDALRKHRDN